MLPSRASRTNDWREVAFYLGRRRVDVAKITDAKLMPNPCPGNSPIGDISAKPLWNGWGNGIANARFQSAKEAGIDSRPGAEPQIEVGLRFSRR